MNLKRFSQNFVSCLQLSKLLHALILMPFVFTLACTDATLETEQLDTNIDGPQFDTGSNKALSIRSAFLPVEIEASCDARIKDVMFSLTGDSFKSTKTLSNSTDDFDCSDDQKITFVLNPQTLGFKVGTPETKTFFIRGETNFGPTRLSQIDITFTNDDPFIRFMSASDQVDETTNSYKFKVQLSQPTDGSETFTVSVSGSATPGTDFNAVVAPVTIEADQLEAEFEITLNDDAVYEADETLVVDIATAPTDFNIEDGQFTLSLIDDDDGVIIEDPIAATTFNAAQSQQVTVSGRCSHPGENVEVSIDTVITDTVTCDTDETWSATLDASGLVHDGVLVNTEATHRSVNETVQVTVDTVAPAAPTMVSGGGVFTLNFDENLAGGGEPDFQDFRFSMDAEQDRDCSSGTSATALTNIEVTTGADHELQAIACDALGNPSLVTITNYTFVPNSPPTATAVAYTPTAGLLIGQTLTGTYSYGDVDADPEGATTFQWYRYDDNAGGGRTAIAGATNSTYTLVAADAAKFIGFEVTPVASKGSPTGSAVESADFGPVSPATQLAYTLQPTTTTAGDTILVTVAIQDSNGTTLTNGPEADADITITLATPGTLSSTTNTLSATNGVASFTATQDLHIDAVGAYQLRASKEDTSGVGGVASNLQTDSSVFAITPAPANKLVFTAQPGDTTAGDDILTTIEVQDAFDNVVTSDTNLYTLNLQSGTGTLFGLASVNAVAGVIDFTAVEGLNIQTTGSKVLRISGNSLTTDDSDSFEINPGPATQLVFTAEPSDTAAGDNLLATAEVRDAFNNVVDTDNRVYNLTLQTGTGPLNGTTSKAAVNGIIDFDAGDAVNSELAETIVLRISGQSLATDDTNSFNITPAAAAKLSFVTQPGATVAGQPITTTIHVLDAFDNLVTGDSGNYTLTLSTGTGSLTGNTSKNAGSGIVSFFGIDAVNIDLIGTDKELTVSGEGLSTDTSDPFTISHAAAANLNITTQPVSSTAGQTLLINAEIHDQFGNLVNTGGDSIANYTATLQSGTGSLLGTTSVNATAGLISFGASETLHVDLVGAKTIRIEDTATSTVFADANAINISHGVATQLVFDVQPADHSAADENILVDVSIRDVFNNIVTTGGDSTSTIDLSLFSGTGLLSGTLSKAASSGTVSFESGDAVRIDRSGPKTLRADKTTGTVLNQNADSFNVAVDNDPDAFSFTNDSDAPLSTSIESNIIPINGINEPSSLSIEGFGPLESVISINGSAQDTFNYSAQLASATGFAFGDNGNKLYVIGDSIVEYDLSSAFQIGSASFVNTFALNGQDNDPQDGYFNSDGSEFFIVGNNTDTVYHYTLGIAWNLSSAAPSGDSFSISGQTTNPSGLRFSPDGSRMFVSENNQIFQYTLSTPWDLNTAEYESISFAMAGRNVTFSSNGHSLLAIAADGTVTRYRLKLPYDVNSTDSDLSTGLGGSINLDVELDNDNNKIFVLDLPADTIREHATNQVSPEYRVCSDAICTGEVFSYRSDGTGSVDVGQFVQLRLTTSTDYESIKGARLTIGGTVTSADWLVNTRDRKNIWTGATDTNWFTPTNWSRVAAPTSDEIAVLTGSDTITVPSTTIFGLHLHSTFSGTLNHSAGSFDLGAFGLLQESGNFSSAGGNLNIAGQLIVEGGSFTATTPLFTGPETSIVELIGNSLTFFQASSHVHLRAPLTVNGDMNFLSGGSLNGGFAVHLTGNLNVFPGTLEGDGMLVFDGPGGIQDVNISSGANAPAGLITVNKATGNVRLMNNWDMAEGQNIDLQSGFIDLNGNTLADINVISTALNTEVDVNCGSIFFEAHSPDDGNITDNTCAYLVFEDSPELHFGVTGFSPTVPKSKTLVVKNRGAIPATGMIGTFTDASHFRFKDGLVFPGFGGSCSGALNPGEECTIEAELVPPDQLLETTELVVTHSAAPSSKIRVSGRGSANGIFTTEHEQFDFGPTAVFNFLEKTLTLTNSGSQSISGVTNPNFSGPFTLPDGLSGCFGTILPGQSCSIQIDFSPGSEDTFTEEFSFDYFNGSGTTSFNIDLTGVGTNDAILVISDGPTFDFGKTGQFKSKSFTLTNIGGNGANFITPLPFANADFNFAGGNFFSSGDCGASLPQGQSCTFTVDFSPTGDQVYSDEISIDYDDGGGTVNVALDLEAESVSSAYLVFKDAPSFDYGVTGTSQPKIHIFEVVNEGASTASSLSDNSTFSNFGFPDGFPGQSCNSGINPGESCFFRVEFIPGFDGQFSETFSVGYFGGSFDATIQLVGTGTTSAFLVVDEAPLYDYGINGQPVQKSFTITNVGSVQANSVSGAPIVGDFTYFNMSFPGEGGTCGTEINAGDSCTFVVEYFPNTGSPSTVNETVRIDYHDGSGSTDTTFNVRGTATNQPHLVLSDGPEFDFGTNGQIVSKTFTLTNVGGSNEFSISNNPLTGNFRYEGSNFFPGDNGTCVGGTLNAGDSCEIVVEFTPAGDQVDTETLSLNYSQGDVDIDLRGTSTTQALLVISDGPTYDYGKSGIEITHEFTITNVGGNTASSINGSSFNTPRFNFFNSSFPGDGGSCSPGGNLNPGESCTAVVAFSGTGPSQQFFDRFEVTYFGGPTNEVSVDITAEKISGSLLVVETVSPVSFGTVGTGGFVKEHDVTIRNIGSGGTGSLSPVNYQYGFDFGFKNGSFPASGTCGGALSSGESCTFTITFAPGSQGFTSDTLIIGYNNGPLNLNVSGVGTDDPHFVIVDSDPVDFGTLGASHTKTKYITLRNEGGNGTSMSGTIDDSTHFDFTNGPFPGENGTCDQFIPVGSTCVIAITYNPNFSTGPMSTFLQLNYTGGPTEIDLEGVGTNAAFLAFFDENSLDFGKLGNTQNETRQIVITNTGDSAATINADNSIMSSDLEYTGGSYPGANGTCPQIGNPLPAQSSCSVEVIFDPPFDGNFSMDLDIEYNDGFSTVNLTSEIIGEAISDAILVFEEGLSYNYEGVGTTRNISKVFNITNIGSSQAQFINLPPLAGEYTYTGGSAPGTGGNCSSTLNPGVTCQVAISYAPGIVDVHQLEYTVDYDNGSNPSSIEINLFGFGTTNGYLKIEEGEDSPVFYAGDTDEGTNLPVFLELVNNGNTNIDFASITDLPFETPEYSFDTSYPGGTGATCLTVGPMLPLTPCNIRVDFAPGIPGVFLDTILLDYNNGSFTDTSRRTIIGIGNED